MATLLQRRKTDRERLKRWRKKKLEEGNKQFLIMLTPEAQKVLDREKARTGKPYVQIINSLIISVEDGPPSASAKTEVRPAWQQKMIRRIKKLRSDGYTYTAIAKIFNDEGIKTFKGFGQWRSSAVSYLDRNG